MDLWRWLWTASMGPVSGSAFAVGKSQDPHMGIFMSVNHNVRKALNEISARAIHSQREAIRGFANHPQSACDGIIEIQAKTRRLAFIVGNRLQKFRLCFMQDGGGIHEYFARISA